MDAVAHYRHLLTLGRDEFLASTAPAILVRYRSLDPDPSVAGTKTLAFDQDPGDTVDEATPGGRFTPEATEMELYPLAKKPGASFPDRITIGREAALPPGAVIRFGDVHVTFYRSSDLFELLGGDHGRR